MANKKITVKQFTEDSFSVHIDNGSEDERVELILTFDELENMVLSFTSVLDAIGWGDFKRENSIDWAYGEYKGDYN